MTSNKSANVPDGSNEPFELDISGMAHGGSAIGRHEGRAIFVPYTMPGERIIARITQDKGRFATAEVLEVRQPAAMRTAPICPHFGAGQCGGCQWQHIDYATQLDFKRQIVADQLARIGGFQNVNVLPTIGSPLPWNYRSRATFHATSDGQLGFVSTDDKHLIVIDECHILRPEILELYYALNPEEIENLSEVRFMVGSDPMDLVVALSTHDNEIPEIEIDFPVSISFLHSESGPQALIGAGAVHYTVKHHTFRVTAGGFFQVNLSQAETLVDQVMARLDLQGHEHVLDLYSGVGLFTAFIAERAAFVAAVEGYSPAVEDADANLNQFENVDLIEGAVEDVLDEIEGHFDLAVIDPPRNGMEVQALDALAKIAPAKIVYVSCDPATCARDLKRLAAKGYRLLEDVQPVDMFPQTASIEMVSTLVRIAD